MRGRWRRATQLVVAGVFLALPFAGSVRLAGTLVALKLGPVDLVEPASALSAVAALRALPWALALAALPLVGLALALGPVYCSWACPFGLVSELRDRLRPRSSRRWTRPPPGRPRRLLLVSLSALLLASLASGLPLAALLAPPRLVTALPLELRTGAFPAVTAALLGLALAVDLLGPRRLVCRALCPAGAVLTLLRTRWTLSPRFDAARCRCPEQTPCLQSCPWGIDPRTMAPRDGCTTCLACLDRCPTGALSLKGGAAPSR